MLKHLLLVVGLLVVLYGYAPRASAASILSFTDDPPAAIIAPIVTAEPTPLAVPTPPPAPVAQPSPLSFHEPDPQGVPAPEDFQQPAPVAEAGIFDGGSSSLVARAVGSAEGTRTPDGGYNKAYDGHTDPGNGVWNQGSFSYQHPSSSPEDADAKQMEVLKSQTTALEEIAKGYGMVMNQEELLNGIDLANQSPKAALDYGGYVDWLAEAKASGKKGGDAIIYARTRAFINPKTGNWDAPGLGNDGDSIKHDQTRRATRVWEAIESKS